MTHDVPVSTMPTEHHFGDGSVLQDSVYTLMLSASGPGVAAMTGWIINWGDGSVIEVESATSATRRRILRPRGRLHDPGGHGQSDGTTCRG